MKKFIINIFYFLSILVVLNTILNHYGNELYLGSYKEHALDFHSYLLSDSRGLPLKTHTETYGVYNFSAESDSYMDMKRKLNYLIKYTKVDTIYLTVDDHTLSPYREGSNNLDRSIYYATQEDYPNSFQYFKDKLLFNIALLQPKKRTILKNHITSYFKSDSNQINNRAIKSWEQLSEVERLADANIRFEYQHPDSYNSEQLISHLEAIIKLCNDHNITLIGIQYPLTRDYLELTRNVSHGASELFTKKGLKVLDYRTIFINNNDYFSNQDHLNDKGGKELIPLLFDQQSD
ncbi:hypothetical protein [uncultured Psychroserpens sp.]|uniref:hypothetical protein n=1 Tax=uncultured Psychroserpens sp. TaxID=255436 RepID=UPI0026043B0C|nr:hypothetical protein [uncultured Psychroserpens sp.]